MEPDDEQQGGVCHQDGCRGGLRLHSHHEEQHVRSPGEQRHFEHICNTVKSIAYIME